MDSVACPIPQISISLAPPEEPLAEPYSPFSESYAARISETDDDSFRPQLLTPPPVRSPRNLSPLSSSFPAAAGKGLERERFEALLRASKERNAAVGAKRTPDLRKEIALKAHKNKQLERRALFLSKVLAPPSPTATILPKTPPESPAIFHYTLPSPGLVSPLALFESLGNDDPACSNFAHSREPWVEQVDFRVPGDASKKPSTTCAVAPGSKGIKSLPSLDQITARMSSQGIAAKYEEPRKTQVRLPAFLTQRREPSPPTIAVIPPPPVERPRLPVGVGRLKMPVRAPKPTKVEHLQVLPPRSPCSPLSPNLQITTLVVPRTSTTSPTELSETNLLALNSRARRAHDMLSTLRRRTLSSDHGLTGHDVEEVEERRSRRQSAPAEPTKRERTGFEHPVLALPGGF